MSITFIGSCISIVSGSPTEETPAAYGVLEATLEEVGKVVSIGELGDESEDVSFDLLKKGRKTHVNGVKDLGEVPITIEYDRTDAGQIIVNTANNGNVTHTFMVEDSDGDKYFFQGLIANLKDLNRTASQYKGANFIIRGQTGITKVDGV